MPRAAGKTPALRSIRETGIHFCGITCPRLRTKPSGEAQNGFQVARGVNFR